MMQPPAAPAAAMATRPILLIGDPRLREVAAPVTEKQLADRATQVIIDELVATMRAAGGAGLAATQIGVALRICAIEVDHNPRYPYKPPIPLTVLVNPVIAPLTEELFENNEGCLSVPSVRGNVARYTEIHVRGWDRLGGAVDFEVRGLSAGTFQHECDHLDGRLFLDRVTDHTTLATWANFEEYQKEGYLRRVSALVGRYGS